jgi:7-cyano-7-deazaguanosine (preQ0) biosynthesis protein QueE
MRISEIFHSIQGEGKNAGKPIIFIRTSGCNLHCHFCDSAFALNVESGEEWAIDQISQELKKYPQCSSVCITGGEPLIQKDFKNLITALYENRYDVEVETNGTIMKPRLDCGIAIQWNVSPKLSNSGHSLEETIDDKTLRGFNSSGLFKFVISDENSFDEAYQIIERLHLNNVYLMPEGRDDVTLKLTAKWLVEKCKQYNYCFSPRLQVWLWGDERGV